MPIHCNQQIRNLSTDQFRELDYRVMRHAFNSHNDLGRLADERIYQADMAARLTSDGMIVRREIELQLSHQAFLKQLFLDLVVAESGVYELKVVKSITEAHVGQLLTYLMLLNLRHGELINFRSEKVESRFVNAPLGSVSRQSFRVDDGKYRGDDRFRCLVVNLLRDWGTSLTLSLYSEAITCLLGGIEVVEAMLPLHRNGVCLGKQRFQLASPDFGFTLTAMGQNTAAYQQQLARLLQHSPLRAIHWINITHHTVIFNTILRN